MQRIIALLTNQRITIRDRTLIIGLWWDDDQYKYFYL